MFGRKKFGSISTIAIWASQAFTALSTEHLLFLITTPTDSPLDAGPRNNTLSRIKNNQPCLSEKQKPNKQAITGGNDILPQVSLILCQIEALDFVTYLVVDGTATVLEDDLADGVGGGEEGVVGEAVGGENPIEVGHQGRCELGL